MDRNTPREEKTRGDELDSRGNKRSDYWTVNREPSQTLQSQAAQGNIQEILKQYKQVGIIENLNEAEAQFLDVTEFTDFGDVMRQAVAAEAEFMKLPSKVREIFEHDVAVWLDTAHDKDKRDALVAAGLIDAPEPVEPVAAVESGDPVVPVVKGGEEDGGGTA